MAAIPYAILGYGRNVRELQRAIDAATYINVGQIRDGRAPLWWDSPAVYRREQQATLPGVERIQTAEELHAMGAGDCDDHAPSLAASLQVAGVPARAVVIESPGIGYHVVVVARDRNGRRRVIDPSARRGMLNPEVGSVRSMLHSQKAQAALTRATQLARRAANMSPQALATKAILSEAKRLASLAVREAEAAEAEDQDDEGSEGE